MNLRFAIIGAQKAASSTLHYYLKQHPEVWLPWEETTAFNDATSADRGPIRELEDRIATSAGGRIAGIKRPDVMCDPQALELLREVCPSVKLLVVLRQPVKRAISAYHHYIRMGFISFAPPDEGLHELFRRTPDSLTLSERQIRDYGCYGRHLERVFSLFQRDQVMVLFDEDLRKRPAETMDEVAKFLNISSFGHFRPANVKAGVYSAPRLKFAYRASRMFHAYFKAGTRLRFRRPALLFRAAVRAFYEFDRVVLQGIYGNEPSRISPETITGMNEYYRQDLLLLEEVLRKNLSSWRQT